MYQLFNGLLTKAREVVRSTWMKDFDSLSYLLERINVLCLLNKGKMKV